MRSMELRKIFYAVMFLLAIIPVIRPFGMPVHLSEQTEGFYDQIAELPPGSKIVFGITLTEPPVAARTFYYALLSYIYQNDLKVIYVPLGVGGELACEYASTYGGIVEEYGLKYGEDYVIMPFLSGEETAMAAVATNFRQAYSMDVRGTPIDDIPLLDGIKDFNDIDLAIAQYGIFTFGEMFVRQWGVKYEPILIIGQFYGIAPYWGTYVIGNIDATLKAMAEMEYLVGIPGEELIRLDSQNLQGAFTIIIVFVSIIVWAVGGRKMAERLGIYERF